MHNNQPVIDIPYCHKITNHKLFGACAAISLSGALYANVKLCQSSATNFFRGSTEFFHRANVNAAGKDEILLQSFLCRPKFLKESMLVSKEMHGRWWDGGTEIHRN
jgi:hypothetical protein